MNRRLRCAAAIALVAVLTGCSYDDTKVPAAGADASSDAAPAPTTPAFTPKDCDNDGSEVASYAPDKDFEPTTDDSASIERIRKRGRLVAGVASDSFLLGSRNTQKTPTVIEGFDIDFVKAIAQAIFGSDDPKYYELRVITPAQRIPFLIDGTVDIVSRNMTINCARWQQIAFSEEYFRSGQKVLVSRTSGIKTVADLAGKRVCAPTGTTSLDNIKQIAPSAVQVTADNDTGCLVKFQNSQTDAISTDDTVLAGLAAQDPFAVVLQTEPLTQEPYGIGVNAERVDLVKFINGVLEQMRADGRWKKSYDRWLGSQLGPKTQPPVYKPYRTP